MNAPRPSGKRQTVLLGQRLSGRTAELGSVSWAPSRVSRGVPLRCPGTVERHPITSTLLVSPPGNSSIGRTGGRIGISLLLEPLWARFTMRCKGKTREMKATKGSPAFSGPLFARSIMAGGRASIESAFEYSIKPSAFRWLVPYFLDLHIS